MSTHLLLEAGGLAGQVVMIDRGVNVAPASERVDPLGELIASLVAGYVTNLFGFGIYALRGNLIVGPKVGGWFFPTRDWWVLMLWVIPSFLAITLSVVLRLSARAESAAAAQQASGLVSLPLIILSCGLSSGGISSAAGASVLVGAVA